MKKATINLGHGVTVVLNSASGIRAVAEKCDLTERISYTPEGIKAYFDRFGAKKLAELVMNTGKGLKWNRDLILDGLTEIKEVTFFGTRFEKSHILDNKQAEFYYRNGGSRVVDWSSPGVLRGVGKLDQKEYRELVKQFWNSFCLDRINFDSGSPFDYVLLIARDKGLFFFPDGATRVGELNPYNGHINFRMKLRDYWKIFEKFWKDLALLVMVRIDSTGVKSPKSKKIRIGNHEVIIRRGGFVKMPQKTKDKQSVFDSVGNPVYKDAHKVAPWGEDRRSKFKNKKPVRPETWRDRVFKVVAVKNI